MFSNVNAIFYSKSTEVHTWHHSPVSPGDIKLANIYFRWRLKHWCETDSFWASAEVKIIRLGYLLSSSSSPSSSSPFRFLLLTFLFPSMYIYFFLLPFCLSTTCMFEVWWSCVSMFVGARVLSWKEGSIERKEGRRRRRRRFYFCSCFFNFWWG